jgi:hypothetical protein
MVVKYVINDIPILLALVFGRLSRVRLLPFLSLIGTYHHAELQSY